MKKSKLGLLFLSSLALVTGMAATGFSGIECTKVANADGESTTWKRATSVHDILLGGTFILGYEATANSGVIVPMQNSGTAKTSAAGILYSGTASGSTGSDTIDMSSVTETSLYEVTVAASTYVDGAITIKCGDNYVGNTNTENNLKLFTSEATTTAFTVTVGTNDVFTFSIAANTTYTTLQYNSGSPRFAVYRGTQKNLVAYKKIGTSAEDKISNLKTKSQLSFNYNKKIESTTQIGTEYSWDSTVEVDETTDYVSYLGLDVNKWIITSEKNDASGIAGLNVTGNSKFLKLYSKTTGSGTSITFENVTGALVESIVINKNSKGTLAIFVGNSDTAIAAEDDGSYLINTNKFTIQNISKESSDTADIKGISINVSTEVSYSIVKNNGKSSVAINYGTFINKKMYDTFKQCDATFGMFYALKDMISGNDTITSLINEGLNDGLYTLDELKSEENILNKECEPARVDSAGIADENGEYYQYGVKISNISEGYFDAPISAVAYIKIDDTYYITEEVSYSVNSLASAYANADDKTSYMEHLGAVQWLSSYNG